MEDIQYFNSVVTWTRTIVLILSITVVVISLAVYNCNAFPVFSLLQEEAIESIALRGHQIIDDMIQDRRLIATLVAAQASIFCPLFLLMSSSSASQNMETVDIWRAVVEHLCQVLMPLGLAMSWIFCITFDKRTDAALVDYYATREHDYWTRCAVYVANGLEHVIIIVLILEVLAVWVSSFKYTSAIIKSQQQVIQLGEEEGLEYIGTYCDEEAKVLLV